MSRSYARMTAHDAGYLDRETVTQPLHYVLQLDVPGEVTPEAVRTQVAAGVARLPLAQRRLRYPLLAGRPVWVDDLTFDVDTMVEAWPTRLQTAADVDDALRTLTLRRLPRDRPLWRVTVAQGPGDASTVWFSVHHAMMDGSLLRTALDELFGPGTPGSETPEKGHRGRPPSRAWLLLIVLLRGVAMRVRRRRRPPSPGNSASPTPTTLTGVVSDRRAIAHCTVSLDAARQARERTGVTLNDLFLAVCTQALRDYLPDCPEQVLALVPRNVRDAQESRTLGNRAWSMLVPLPVGHADPAERVRIIQDATTAGKDSTTTSGTQGWRFDIALTNVALGGPHHVAGNAVRGLRASVPLQGTNRLVALLTSYGDDLTVTWTVDGVVYPDAERLSELTSRAWGDLLVPVRGTA